MGRWDPEDSLSSPTGKVAPLHLSAQFPEVAFSMKIVIYMVWKVGFLWATF